MVKVFRSGIMLILYNINIIIFILRALLLLIDSIANPFNHSSFIVLGKFFNHRVEGFYADLKRRCRPHIIYIL